MQFIYSFLAVVLVILAAPVFVFRTIREKGFGERLRQSFGLWPKNVLTKVAGHGCIWLHAASVGEIVAASPIVKEIRRELPEYPILISVVTESGYEMAQRIIPEADGVIYFPVDLPWLSERVVRRIRPRAFLPVETELWPNFLRATRRHGIPVMMVNGRISDKSSKRYHYLGKVLKNMLAAVDKFCMQSAIDAEYITKLGAKPDRVVITGNTKYDQTYTDVSATEKNEIYRQLGLTDKRPVLLAGSTHKGEEDQLFDAFITVRQTFAAAAMVIAPRDILRAEELIKLAADKGFKAAKRTVLKDRPSTDHDVVILDTIGELGKIYSIGDIIFVGGSLIAQGGHNILEPAAHGKPIFVGPHMFNFKEIYALLSGRGACETVQTSAELADKIIAVLVNEEHKAAMSANALAIIEENRGAARKSALYLRELLTQEFK